MTPTDRTGTPQEIALQGFTLSGDLAEQAVLSRRFSVMTRLDADLPVIATWDSTLPRLPRVLVPIDVQAYVVAGDGEKTVDVRGAGDDPAPFAEGATRAPGVHLHWALPDALLSGRHDPATNRLDLPTLPDRWVVLRSIQPVGRAQALVTGWVVDARTGQTTDLATYAGGPVPPPDGADPAPDRVDGSTHGLGWTASYAAARGRLTFHDPLDLGYLAQVAPQGIAGDQAVYTVCGWWGDDAADPLHAATTPASLLRVVRSLGWSLDHDDDRSTAPPSQEKQGTAAALGQDAPEEDPGGTTVLVDEFGRPLSTGVRKASAFNRRATESASRTYVGASLPRYRSLLHGSVLGVPIRGAVPEVDDRPDPEALSVAVGADVDDVVSAFASRPLTGDRAASRRAVEDLFTAFASGGLARLSAVDGLDDLTEAEHSGGFWSFAGPPVPGAQPDRLREAGSLATGPTTVGRRGRAAADPGGKGRGREGEEGSAKQAAKAAALRWVTDVEPRRTSDKSPSESAPPGEVRTVTRPAPRLHRPRPLVLALRGARPHARYLRDREVDAQGAMACRYPAEAVSAISGVVTGAQILPSLGSGAVPEEVLTVVRESVLLNPYADDWLSRAGAPPTDTIQGAYAHRVAGEMALLYGHDGRYDGQVHLASTLPKAGRQPETWEEQRDSRTSTKRRIADELAYRSAIEGRTPSPLAITTWRQPWAPLQIEWEVDVEGTTTTAGWEVVDVDLARPDGTPPAPTLTSTLTGRSVLGRGAGEQLREAVRAWIAAEHSRMVTPSTTAHTALQALRDLADQLTTALDLVSASLDGLYEQLLGIAYVGQVTRGSDGKPVATGSPAPLFGGVVTLRRARLVDAFGRTCELPSTALAALATTLDLEVPGRPGAVQVRPRLLHGGRWLWRLIDASRPAGTPVSSIPEAFVHQVDPAAAVSPVAGFLLPDHIDEGLETFTSGGEPIGQVSHDPTVASGAPTEAVTWEPAPGRPVPPDAGPLTALAAQDRLVGEIAAGLVRADAAARASGSPPEVSALTALLRAVDTTLWSVDTFAGVGSASLAGLVGRPIAVVRTALTLQAPDDLAEVTVTAPGGIDARRAAFTRLEQEVFEVRLGTLGRADDALLGYFVDDDFEHLRLVDRTVAYAARETGRHVGQQGLLGETTVPDVAPLVHPYLVDGDTLPMRAGQTRLLTLLMLPGGKAHLTSGILPRKSLALADSWVGTALTRMSPSVRVGPVLVDPAEIRLPMVSTLGDDQTFTRRTGELTWADDPILAATQTAYLPRLPHEVQEGWIRVTPIPHEPPAGGAP